MLKSGAIRSLARSTFSTSRLVQWHSAARRTQFHSLAYSKVIQSRALYPSKRAFTTSQQLAAEKHIPDDINTKREERLAHAEIEPHPEDVSSGSSVRHVFHEEGVEEKEKEIDMLAGVKSDLVRISLTT